MAGMAKRKTSDGNGNQSNEISAFKRKPCDEIIKTQCINDIYNRKEFIDVFGRAFRRWDKLEDSENGHAVCNKPFKYCRLPNFINDDKLLRNLTEELQEIDYNFKNNDLYKFSQSDDLKNIDLPCIKKIRNVMQREVLEWIKTFTKIPLTSTIDLTASQYNHTDVLLCHDDKLEGRRIAFILYLVPSWSEADGGTLDLFSADSSGQPCPEPLVRILPEWNTFLFFEVTDESFHQVSEVLSLDKCRLSLNGWFHGPPPPPLKFYRPLFLESDELLNWINPLYFDVETQLQIRNKFEEECEIELTSFLIDSVFQKISCELREGNMSWRMLTPPNKRHYEECEDVQNLETTSKCLNLFRSKPFFLFLSTISGLTLHPLAANDKDENTAGSSTDSNDDNADGTDSRCSIQLTRWRHGSYTLVCDKQESDFRLDLKLFFNCDGWIQEYGGFTSYIARDEDKELLSISPHNNSLAVVYRDRDTVGFVKYVSKTIEEMNEKGEFYSINGVYME